VAALKKNGPEVMDTIFAIRLRLRQKLQEFDTENVLSRECMLKVREGFQFARFSEEYLLEWLYSQKVFEFKASPILAPLKPATWINNAFTNFKIQSGDVLLIRGKSYVSAMIARIGDEEGNFSHLAIVGEDPKGQLYVVEALIASGAIVTPLEEWRKSQDARVVLYRPRDQEIAKKAARIAYDTTKTALDAGKPIRYDFAMDDADSSAWFCSETVLYAYAKASVGQLIIPKFRSTVNKFKNTDYLKSLGVNQSTLFAPYDIEVDPRFELVAEYRHQPLLRQVRMQDSVLQSLYAWMIERKYSFHWSPQHSSKAYFAKFIRQFGFAAKSLPTYMPMDSLKTNIQIEAVATALEENLFVKEDEFYKTRGYLPSFQDMLRINEDYRKEDCLWFKEGKPRTPQKRLGAYKHFHSYFRNEPLLCE
jgi:hypothetical protein